VTIILKRHCPLADISLRIKNSLFLLKLSPNTWKRQTYFISSTQTMC